MTTYVIYSVDEWIIAAITHCEPVTAEPYDIDVVVPVYKQKKTSLNEIFN